MRAHDNHLHLCLYFLDPLSIVPRPPKTRSTIQIGAYANGTAKDDSQRRPSVDEILSASLAASTASAAPSTPATIVGRGDEDEEDGWELAMSEFDLRAIARLQKRINVLPVIGRADELTAHRLEEVKAVIKRDLKRAGITWGVFASSEDPSGAISSGGTSGAEDGNATPTSRKPRVDSRPVSPPSADTSLAESEQSDLRASLSRRSPPPEPVEQPVRLIRVRSRSRAGTLGRSVSRRMLVQEEQSDEDDTEEDAGQSYEESLPFALVAPDEDAPRARGSQDGQKPRFAREYKHATVDVLNPLHSDFGLLRDALLGGVMKSLKDATRLDKYEPYRTERLLARKATRGLAEGDVEELAREVARI